MSAFCKCPEPRTPKPIGGWTWFLECLRCHKGFRP